MLLPPLGHDSSILQYPFSSSSSPPQHRRTRRKEEQGAELHDRWLARLAAETDHGEGHVRLCIATPAHQVLKHGDVCSSVPPRFGHFRVTYVLAYFIRPQCVHRDMCSYAPLRFGHFPNDMSLKRDRRARGQPWSGFWFWRYNREQLIITCCRRHSHNAIC